VSAVEEESSAMEAESSAVEEAEAVERRAGEEPELLGRAAYTTPTTTMASTIKKEPAEKDSSRDDHLSEPDTDEGEDEDNVLLPRGLGMRGHTCLNVRRPAT